METVSEAKVLPYSDALADMVEGNYGYRNEAFMGDNTNFTARQILEYEILDLGNTDIKVFCANHYGITAKSSFNFLSGLFKYLTHELGTDQLYAVWLTTRKGVEQYYVLPDADADLIRYELPAHYVVISDLSHEGALFISTMPMKKWKHNRV